MTTTTAQRFALDEEKAREWLAAEIAAELAYWAAGVSSEPSALGIGASYRASSGDYAEETAGLVEAALREGIISDPEKGDLDSLAWDFIPSDGSRAWSYRWLLSAGPGNVITVTYPSPDDPWGIGLNADNREIAGVESALSVLREAVQAGNELNERLAEYVAWLPLAVRAPEVAQLAAAIRDASLPSLEPFELSDVIAELATQWLDAHGYDLAYAPRPDGMPTVTAAFHADCACCMSGCGGDEPGTVCRGCGHAETGTQ